MARDSISPARSIFTVTINLKVGFDFSHSSYDAASKFLPVDIVGAQERHFSELNSARRLLFSVHQNEFAWFGGDSNGRSGLVFL